MSPVWFDHRMGYVGSYTWQLRKLIGSRLLLMPGAQVVLLDSAEHVLFQQRRDSGLWEIPAGAAEPGGSFVRTAIDEVREETGLTVEGSDLVAFGCLSEASAHVITYPNGDQMHCFAMCFEARRWSGVIEPESSEVLDVAFADPARPPGQLQAQTRVVLEMHAAYRLTGRFQAR
ncbi:NUDIX domain-containing protein [Micromonospora sp. HUAS YX12]|uniref:NUDIX domain-containing protein n=1 Tax=Micromonospora sp. HUAS YX12 TaxID=3156396 RepID=A0AAU7R907_9ACTN